MFKKLLKVNLVITSLLLSPLASADYLLHRWERFSEEKGRLTLAPSVHHYYSQTNFDYNGNEVAIADFDSYERTEFDTRVSYGILRKLTLYGRLSWVRVAANHFIEGGESFGLGDQSVGANFRLLETDSGLELSLQSQLDFPAYTNDFTIRDGTPFLGDQTIDVLIGGWGWIPLSSRRSAHSFSVEAGAAFKSRSDGFTNQLAWSARLGYERTGVGLGFGLGANGVVSLEQVPAGAAIGNPCALIYGASGSCAVNSTFASQMKIRVDASYFLNQKMALVGDFNADVIGTAAPKGIAFGGGLRIHLGQSEEAKKRRKPRKSNEGFVPYTSFEARVIRVNDRFNLVKIDKGRSDGLKAGQKVDIFSVKPDGTIRESVARGRITSLKAQEAAIKIIEYFKEVWIEEGFVVKPPLE